MKLSLIDNIQCVVCKQSAFAPALKSQKYGEWREGLIHCQSCGQGYSLDDGIVDFLVDKNDEIKKEREGAHAEVRIHTGENQTYTVTPQSIQKFKHVFLALPQGDGSYFFKQGGSFQNFREGAHRFYSLIDKWNLRPGQKVLEIGSGFCWAAREFADRGCELTAVDICNYLKVADLYLERGLFFERVYADMNRLPFKENSFDMVFAAAAIHHSSDFQATFKELHRVLKKGGKLVMLNECFIGCLEKRPQHDESFAFNDHYHTVPYWIHSLKKSADFKKIRVAYLSFFKDYTARKESRDAKSGFKYLLAKKISNHVILDNLLSLFFIPFRVLIKPRSVLIEAVK